MMFYRKDDGNGSNGEGEANFLNREKCVSSPDPRSLRYHWKARSVAHRSRRKEAINVGVPTRGYSWEVSRYLDQGSGVSTD